MNYMFYLCSSLTSLDLNNFDTSNATNMAWMFHSCNNLTNLKIDNFNTPKVTSIASMFYNCNNLTNLNMSNFNTSNVTHMNAAFAYYNNLISLDLSNFDTSKVITMTSMFYNCSSLTKLDLSTFNTVNVTNFSEMFFGCNNIKEAYARSIADAERLNAVLNKPKSWSFVSTAPIINLTINNLTQDLVTIEVPSVIEGGVTEFVLVPTDSTKTVTSFKLNGKLIEGKSFIAPKTSREVIISDVVLTNS